MRSCFVAGGCVVALSLGSSTGCASANHYQTAVPLDRGTVSITGAVDVVHLRARGTQAYEEDTSGRPFVFGTTLQTTTVATGIPSMHVRYGAHERVQVGGMIGFGRIGVDVMLGLRRGDLSVALMIAPSWQEFRPYLDVPLLVSYRLAEGMTFVASPGLIAAGDTRDGAAAPGGAFVRAGLGARITLYRSLFVFPELTPAHHLGESLTWVTGGLGLGGVL